MHPRHPTRLGSAALGAAGILALSAAPSAWAGGAGHGGAVFHAGGGFHGTIGGYHGPSGGGSLRFGNRGLPPVSGVIHERPGMTPYISAYGHTNTAARFGGFARPGFGGYGHTDTAAGWGGYGRAGFGRAAYAGHGHVDTAVRRGGYDRPGLVARGIERYGRGLAFRDRFRATGLRGRFGYGGGGYGGGYGGYGDDGDVGAYGGGAGNYPAAGIGAASGTYGGSYGGGTYGGGYGGGAYASETPLAARFAEPPLAPSPGASYSPGDRYAYAASEDVGPGPRIISVSRAARPGCGCGPGTRVEPIIYRYGVGTAY